MPCACDDAHPRSTCTAATPGVRLKSHHSLHGLGIRHRVVCTFSFFGGTPPPHLFRFLCKGLSYPRLHAFLNCAYSSALQPNTVPFFFSLADRCGHGDELDQFRGEIYEGPFSTYFLSRQPIGACLRSLRIVEGLPVERTVVG